MSVNVSDGLYNPDAPTVTPSQLLSRSCSQSSTQSSTTTTPSVKVGTLNVIVENQGIGKSIIPPLIIAGLFAVALVGVKKG